VTHGLPRRTQDGCDVGVSRQRALSAVLLLRRVRSVQSYLFLLGRPAQHKLLPRQDCVVLN